MTRAEHARRTLKASGLTHAQAREAFLKGHILAHLWFDYLPTLGIDTDDPNAGEQMAWMIAEDAYWQGTYDVLRALVAATDVLTAEEGVDFFELLREEVRYVRQRQMLMRAECGSPQ